MFCKCCSHSHVSFYHKKMKTFEHRSRSGKIRVRKDAYEWNVCHVQVDVDLTFVGGVWNLGMVVRKSVLIQKPCRSHTHTHTHTHIPKITDTLERVVDRVNQDRVDFTMLSVVRREDHRHHHQQQHQQQHTNDLRLISKRFETNNMNTWYVSKHLCKNILLARMSWIVWSTSSIDVGITRYGYVLWFGLSVIILILLKSCIFVSFSWNYITDLKI